jgi:uncharacterized protein YbjT (DUF2867 family)
MAKAPILVVGATGTVGAEVVKQLVLAGQTVRVLARDPKKASERLVTGIEIVAGDLADPGSLAGPLRGVEVAYLATSPTPLLAEQEGNFIEAAKAAKLRRLVKLGAFGIEFAADRIHSCHADSEKRLRASGLGFVVLRPVIFMANLLFEVPAIKSGKLPSVFGDAPMAFVDPRDVAELAARALVEEKHEGATWEFGGPDALTYDDVAATFSRILGRRIEHVRVTEAEFKAAALGAGFPDFVVEAITVSAAEAREGKYATTDGVVQRVLGRRAASLSDWLSRHRDAFTP